MGPDTVIVLFYAVGCIAFGFLVGVVVMVMDKRREGRATSSRDNLEGKVTDQNLCSCFLYIWFKYFLSLA